MSDEWPPNGPLDDYRADVAASGAQAVALQAADQSEREVYVQRHKAAGKRFVSFSDGAARFAVNETRWHGGSHSLTALRWGIGAGVAVLALYLILPKDK